ncbi:hypothetical protein MTR_3g015480 [Medicago truncatula]|uniref:Uncharacterized protein n=1 Tax=Medicago truncatula TaxID=3880 RepID=G7IVX3_MEDTR|nr:hypothetical protein MTR_3g015480 [Medicago truncatula]
MDVVTQSACASAITSSNPPSAICCSKLKERKPSFANTWCGVLQHFVCVSLVTWL